MIFPNGWNGFYPQKSRKSPKNGIPNINFKKPINRYCTINCRRFVAAMIVQLSAAINKWVQLIVTIIVPINFQATLSVSQLNSPSPRRSPVATYTAQQHASSYTKVGKLLIIDSCSGCHELYAHVDEFSILISTRFWRTSLQTLFQGKFCWPSKSFSQLIQVVLFKPHQS